jgi:hydrogenase expression/formation protein HypC
MCLAVPGRVESITGDGPLDRMAQVNFGGVLKEVSLACVPEAGVGDYVIVHVGFALSKVDEEEAREVLDLLRQLDSAAGQELSIPNEEQT